jgi:hypothetical protein
VKKVVQERAYSVDGEVDLVEQAMRILQTKDDTPNQTRKHAAGNHRSDRVAYEPDHDSQLYDSNGDNTDDNGDDDDSIDEDSPSDDSVAPKKKVSKGKSKNASKNKGKGKKSSGEASFN